VATNTAKANSVKVITVRRDSLPMAEFYGGTAGKALGDATAVALRKRRNPFSVLPQTARSIVFFKNDAAPVESSFLQPSPHVVDHRLEPANVHINFAVIAENLQRVRLYATGKP
jgi:hypothetical protein